MHLFNLYWDKMNYSLLLLFFLYNFIYLSLNFKILNQSKFQLLLILTIDK